MTPGSADEFLVVGGGIIFLGLLICSILGFWVFQLFRRGRKKEITHELLKQGRSNGTIAKSEEIWNQ